MDEIRVILCTFPDPEKARQIGTQLVELQYAACVNLIPRIQSIYRWQGTIETDTETLALIKTTAAGLDRLKAELTALHPYDVPEIIALHPADVSAPYQKWLGQNIAPTP
ncbi:MAG: divalent-cation tolerance protein CutA [Verrucomicrobiota bacterium JB025]|nr:divalent-cation tolerance protein CutA [Verrucomicrobiota bacterium JB025]